MRKEGRVKFFNEKKGFGFIESENKDYFVYFTEINQSGFKTLIQDELVSFAPSSGAKGLVAKEVLRLNN